MYLKIKKMKKVFAILLVLINISEVFPQACTPDPQYVGNPGVYPDSITGIADAYVGVPYSDVITFVNPDDTTINLPGVGIVTLILNYYKPEFGIRNVKKYVYKYLIVKQI
jgi:hypothetical protein